MKAAEFDVLFDEGEKDVLEYLDLEKAQRPQLNQEQITLELPVWMLDSLDKEATRRGQTRESLIKTWLADELAQVVRPG
jgi:hypothetical protein